MRFLDPPSESLETCSEDDSFWETPTFPRTLGTNFVRNHEASRTHPVSHVYAVGHSSDGKPVFPGALNISSSPRVTSLLPPNLPEPSRSSLLRQTPLIIHSPSLSMPSCLSWNLAPACRWTSPWCPLEGLLLSLYVPHLSQHLSIRRWDQPLLYP